MSFDHDMPAGFAVLLLLLINQVKYKTQQARHGQTTSKQRYINVDSVGTTLFRRRLTMMCQLGNIFKTNKPYSKKNKEIQTMYVFSYLYIAVLHKNQINNSSKICQN